MKPKNSPISPSKAPRKSSKDKKKKTSPPPKAKSAQPVNAGAEDRLKTSPAKPQDGKTEISDDSFKSLVRKHAVHVNPYLTILSAPQTGPTMGPAGMRPAMTLRDMNFSPPIPAIPGTGRIISGTFYGKSELDASSVKFQFSLSQN